MLLFMPEGVEWKIWAVIDTGIFILFIFVWHHFEQMFIAMIMNK